MRVLAGGGCGGRDDGSSPEAAVRSLIAAARAGDRAAVYAASARAPARISRRCWRRRNGPAARMLRPEDLVTVGWLPPAWEPAGMRLLRRDGTEAEVEVYSAAGDRQTISTVREGKSWKVELPFR